MSGDQAAVANSPDNRAFHVELDLPIGGSNHETFVIIDALSEYASRERWLAEDGGDEAHNAFLDTLADTADRLRERIDAQMCDANVVELTDPEGRYNELKARYEAGETELGIEVAKLRGQLVKSRRRVGAVR